MSMSVRDDATGLEYAGALGPRGLFPTARQPGPAGVPPDARRDPALPPPGASAAERPASRPTRPSDRCGSSSPTAASRRTSSRHFMEPLVAAVWSCDPDVALDYPARYLFSSSTTTGCSASSARRSGAPSPAAPASTSSASPPGCPRCRTGTKVTSVLETADGVEVTDGNGVVRRTTPSWSPPTRPGAGHARRADRGAARGAGRDPLLAQRRPAAHRHLPAAAAQRARGRPGTSVARSTAAARSTVTYDLTRLQRLATDDPLPGHPRRRGPRRPRDRDRPHGVRAPALHPRLRRRPAAAPRDRHRPRRVRRRLPRVGLPRGRRALRAGRRRAARAAWVDGPASGAGFRAGAGAPSSTSAHRIYDTTIRHTRRTPFRRSFTHRSHTWLVDLDAAARPRRARPVRGARPPRRRRTASIRDNVDAFLALHDIDLRGGRVLMAAQRTGLRLLLQPDQRLLVPRRRRRAGGRRGRGAQHLRRPARLPRPPRRAGAGHHAEADVRLAVPRHRRPLRPRRADSRRSGSRSPSRCAPTTARCSAPPCRGPAAPPDRGAPPPPRCAGRC